MKTVTTRSFHGYALFVAVLAYAGIIYKLFDTGWINNVTTTTLIVTILILGAVAMILWNLVAQFYNSKKEAKK